MRMDITFKRLDEGALVLLDGVVIGAVSRRELLGRGYSKSQMSTRHVVAWTPTVVGVDGLHLDQTDERGIERAIKRSKTTRRTAALHLIEAYAEAGVPLPDGRIGSLAA